MSDTKQSEDIYKLHERISAIKLYYETMIEDKLAGRDILNLGVEITNALKEVEVLYHKYLEEE